jgi:hypothetical protein
VLYAFSSRTLMTYEAGTLPGHALSVVFAAAMVLLCLMLALFPDGQAVPRAARWIAPAMLAVAVAFPDGGRVLTLVLDGDHAVTGRVAVLILLWAGAILAGLAAQVHRYRHVSSLTQRQQAKWVMAPLGLMTVGMILVLALSGAPTRVPARLIGWVLLVVLVPAGAVMPVMVANAVLHYRLYEIDRIISRTVSYALVVAALVGIYAAGVIGAGSAISGLTGQRSTDLDVAISVLAVVAAFRPLQRRVQAAVDQRFDRTGYEARRVVEGFPHGLRDEADLEAIRRQLATAATRAVRPSHVSVWLANRTS